jgi:dTDP-4-dehydrorhamnose reductase
MRILVTGASGLLGLNLAIEALEGHEIWGTARRGLRSAPFHLVPADLIESGSIQRLLAESNAEAVIHCAAFADIDWCERNPELSASLNTEVPRELAQSCARDRLRLIHVSTDAVFDGRKEGFYSERDTPHPLGVYASTKLAAERAVLSAYPEALVARVNFYGWSIGGERSLGEFFANNLGSGRRVDGFTDVFFCPLFVGHLARILISLLTTNLRGVYHVVGRQALSKYDFGLEIARKFGFDSSLIAPRSVESAGLNSRRSHNLRLAVDKLSTDWGGTPPDFSTGMDAYYRQFRAGYPQKLHSFRGTLATTIDPKLQTGPKGHTLEG